MSSRRVSIRGTLKPVLRRRSSGRTEWFARGQVPIRDEATGEIRRERREFRLAAKSSSARQAEADALNRDFEQAAEDATGATLSFAAAYENYIRAGFRVPLYFETIVRELGPYPATEIDDTKVLAVRARLFRPDAAPSYINRHLMTPVRAILRMALRERAPIITRPAGHKQRAEGTRIEIPSPEWFAQVTPHLDPDRRALLAFLTSHGRRLGDALGRVPADFDPVRRTLLVDRTKNGEPVEVDIHPDVARLMAAMPAWQSRRWLFRDGPNSGSNVRRDIIIACCRAAGVDVSRARKSGWAESEARAAAEANGVPVYCPHEIGRHSFATRLLKEGHSLEFVRRAGGWKSIEVVARLYGHLEQRDWRKAVHRSADSVLAVMSGTN